MKEDDLVHAASETDGPPNGQLGSVQIETLISRLHAEIDLEYNRTWAGSPGLEIATAEEAASALRFLLQEREWKPIETAVKSSTPIQIANADEIATGRYGAGYDDGGHYREGWTVDGEFWDPQPTHWKPLPAPPQRQGDRPELPNDLRSRETNGPQL